MLAVTDLAPRFAGRLLLNTVTHSQVRIPRLFSDTHLPAKTRPIPPLVFAETGASSQRQLAASHLPDRTQVSGGHTATGQSGRMNMSAKEVFLTV